MQLSGMGNDRTTSGGVRSGEEQRQRGRSDIGHGLSSVWGRVSLMGRASWYAVP